MVLWRGLLHITSSISFAGRKDVIVLRYYLLGLWCTAPALLQSEIPSRFHVFIGFLSPNRQCDRHDLVGDISQLFFECPLAKLWWPKLSKLVEISVGILLNVGSVVTRIDTVVAFWLLVSVSALAE